MIQLKEMRGKCIYCISLDADGTCKRHRPLKDNCPLFDAGDECYCYDCHWNDDNHCMIPKDDHITFDECCPYRSE